MRNIMKLEYINHLGSDTSLVQISRVCTGNNGGLTKEKVAKNLSNLVRDKHWSVFDHAKIQYRIEAPIYVARQWMRHDAAYMEKSLRYTKNPKLQPFTHGIKPYGSLSDYMDNIGGYDFGCDPLWAYDELLDRDFKPEDARRVLPLETLTTIVITTSLRDAFFLISQRLDSHAQGETRELAEMLLKLLKELFPLATLAYLEWEYGSFSISVYELDTLLEFMDGGNAPDKETYDVLRRFMYNAEKRIKSVEREANRIKQQRKDPEGNVDDTQLQFDFDQEIP